VEVNTSRSYHNINNFLGQEVCQRTDEIFLSQGKYTMGILKKFSITRIQIHAYTDGDGFEENK
jgi:hypothetical protein